MNAWELNAINAQAGMPHEVFGDLSDIPGQVLRMLSHCLDNSIDNELVNTQTMFWILFLDPPFFGFFAFEPPAARCF